MAEYNISDCIAAMSKYHQDYHNNVHRNHSFFFALHPNILFYMGQYFADLLEGKFAGDVNVSTNTFEGIEIMTSNDIEEGVILAVQERNRVFP